MTYQDDFAEFEQKMFTLARTMRGAVGKDRSLFLLAATVRRLRRLLRAMEHELDWAVMDFLDGWPGTEAGYNSLERGMIFNRPYDSDRYEQIGHLERIPGYNTPQWVEENKGLLEIVPFKDRDITENSYTKALKHAKDVMEAGYREADKESPAVVSYQATQTVTENQLLTWYQRGRDHQREIDRAALYREQAQQREAEQLRQRQPAEGWSLFDWTTGERIGPATLEQVTAFQKLVDAGKDEPLLVSTKDPTEISYEWGWRQGMDRVKEGRKWVTRLIGPHHRPSIDRPVRVGQNELSEVKTDE
jgi:hypothetical protein